MNVDAKGGRLGLKFQVELPSRIICSPVTVGQRFLAKQHGSDVQILCTLEMMHS
jgi:hypothetical protein